MPGHWQPRPASDQPRHVGRSWLKRARLSNNNYRRWGSAAGTGLPKRTSPRSHTSPGGWFFQREALATPSCQSNQDDCQGVHRQEERPGPPAPPHPVLSPDLVFPDPLVLQETPSRSEKTVQQMPSPFSWPTEGLQPRKVHWLCKWLGRTALTTGPALCHPEGLSPQKTCIITN